MARIAGAGVEQLRAQAMLRRSGMGDPAGPLSFASLTFELSMHPGMDGPHDLGVHMPVDDGTGTRQLLTLDVSGDFRN